MTTKVNFTTKKLQAFTPVKVAGLNAEKIDAKISIENNEVRKYCLGNILSNQSISTWTQTILNFNDLQTNDNNMRWSSGEIKIVNWWLYIIALSVAWANSSGGVMRQSQLQISDNIVCYSNDFLSNNACNNLTYIWNFNSGDVIKAIVYQDSWSSLNVQVSGTYLQVLKI